VPVAYPVTVAIEPQLANRNRLTVAFRIILTIPHLILVGGVGLGLAVTSGGRDRTSLGGETGVLGGVAWILAIVSWVTIVIGGEHINAVRRFSRFYLRWRVRALAYLMLLEDRYPPFGDGPYPATVTVTDPSGKRNRLSVGFRIILVIPHLIVLVFLMFAWWVTAFVAWLLILVTAKYPQGLSAFGVAAMRWLIRVEAYMLLLTDEYPPFSFT
jgi:Domain of unknown function (DUF4389)